MEPGTELVPRATIDEIVGHRNQALQLFCEAHAKIEAAAEAVKNAHEIASMAYGSTDRFLHGGEDEIKAFYNSVNLPERDWYLTVARKIVDGKTWAGLIERTNLERLMDVQAKDDLAKQLKYQPEKRDAHEHRQWLATGQEERPGLPEITVENVRATLQGFAANADHIWRRGLANAFAKLDRRFKSHDGFKIGSRMILSRAFDDWGHWNYHHDQRARLLDVERVFLMLDGIPVPDAYAGIVGVIDGSRSRGLSPETFRVENEYFKCDVYLNGNLHVWFKRKDLLQQVNKILGEWYGEVIGDAHAEEDIFAARKTAPAKYFGFYPTPDDAAERLFQSLPTCRRKEDPQPRMLEPSAGTGNLARRMVESRMIGEGWGDGREEWSYCPLVDCVELQSDYARRLDEAGCYNRVLCRDFLTVQPSELGEYDLIVMNPPFDLERDIDHVTHAMKFLAPNGCLAAIMSAGTEFRQTKKAIAFRKLMKEKGAEWRELPPGSFSECGTNVNTVMVKFWNHDRKFW